MLRFLVPLLALLLAPAFTLAQVSVPLASASLGNESAKREAELISSAALPVTGREMFLLQAKVSMSKPDMEMALNFWRDYHEADAFGRKDAAAVHRPELDKAKDLVWAAKTFSAVVFSEIGDYDMARKGFPVARPSKFGKALISFPYHPGSKGPLQLIFTNMETFGFLPFEESMARKLVTACRGTFTSRCSYAVQYVFEPLSAGSKGLYEGMPPTPFVTARVVAALVYVDPNGRSSNPRATPDARIDGQIFVGKM